MRICLVLFLAGVILLQAQWSPGWDLGTESYRFYIEEVVVYWGNSAAKVHKSQRLRKVFLTGSKIILQGTGVFIIKDMKGSHVKLNLEAGKLISITMPQGQYDIP